jgi:CRP-like cAMP-binding protein
METVRLLELDPDLARGVAEADQERATQALVAGCYEIPRGPWQIQQPSSEVGAYGLLVARGLLSLRTSIAERATLEILGQGELLRPWVQLGAEMTAPPTAGWQVLEPASIVVLDKRFALAAGEWPEVAAALMHRLVLRSRRLCYQLAVNTAPQVEQRLLYSLWALADRWGRVTEEGTLIELRLTHQQVAELVAAQRPSVSTALNRLRDERKISYGRERFLLRGDVPGEVERLRGQLAL